ncbi:vascular cell adhesion protein 1 [Diretmus argenteus]
MLPLRMLGLVMLMPFQGDAEACSSEVNPLILDPPELVVEYGQPAEVNCSSLLSEHPGMYWGDDKDSAVEDDEFITWAENVSDWNQQLQCNMKLNASLECSKDLLITVYKNPENIVMYPLSHSYSMVDGTQYELQCDILDVAPVRNLTVTWYLGNETVKIDNFGNTTKTPVTESSILTITLSKKLNKAECRYKPVVECQTHFTGNEHNFSLSTVPCRADGNPPAHVEWYHQGKRMNASLPLTRMHSGEYDFIANNTVGSANGTIAVTVEYAPDFQQPVSTVSVAEGDDVSLDCDAQGNPAPELQWATDAVGLNTLNNVGSILNITGVTTDQTYYCTASNYLGIALKQINLRVITAEPPTPAASDPRESCPLELTPAKVVVRYGGRASVNCSTSSTTHELMGWEATSGSIAPEGNVTFITWTVEKLEDWDTSPKCFIKDHDMECVKTLDVILYKTPDAVSFSQLVHGPMTEGTKYTLQCDITNVAPLQNLTVKWYRGNETIGVPKSIPDARRTPGDAMSSLSYTPSNKDDGAEFRCEAELNLGPEGPQPLPAVMSEPHVAVVHYKPLIQDCPNHYTGVEGNFTLSMVPCRADGNPATTVQWYHGGTPINASEQLNRTHSGMFEFKAQNIIGDSIASVGITVEYGPMLTCHDRYTVEENAVHLVQCDAEGNPEPRITWFKDGQQVSFPMRLTRHDNAPEFQQENDTLEVTVGDDVLLVCSAEGNPPPTLQWRYTSAENVKETPGGRQRNVSITGATSTNTGIYICVATNEVGSVTRSTTLMMNGIIIDSHDGKTLT